MLNRHLTVQIIGKEKRFCRILTWGLALLVCLMLAAMGAAQEGIPCIPEPTDKQIEYGDLVICEIDPIGDSDLFRFEGSPGEHIVVQASRHSRGYPCVQVFRPDGTPIGPPVCSQPGIPEIPFASINAMLNQSGTYTILVTEHDNNETMEYALALERVAPVPSPSARSICFGCLHEDEINPVGDLDEFFFAASQNDVITVQASRQNRGYPCIQVFRPDGTSIGPACAQPGIPEIPFARIDAMLNQSGIYTILVTERDNNETMGYSVNLGCLAGTCAQFSDRVRILTASFFNPFDLLSVAATSSAAPDTELFVTVPGCVDNALMEFRENGRKYVFAGFCPGLVDPKMATVTSRRRGSDSAPIDFFTLMPK